VSHTSGDLALIASSPEVEIETHGPDGAVHRTVIWAVVEDATVLVRSVNGRRARWYREALAQPGVRLHVDGVAIPVRTSPATDPASVAACSAGLRRKYAGDFSLGSMLVPEILDTTLRLDPA
jgi:hypothetical protein